MGKLVQVKSSVSSVRLPPLGLMYIAGETTTLTDAEYTGLTSSVKNGIVVVKSGLADPVRSTTGDHPSSAADAYKLAKSYTDAAVKALASLGIDPPSEMATHTEVDGAVNTAKSYTDTKVTAEASSRTTGDTSTLNSAKTYTDTAVGGLGSAFDAQGAAAAAQTAATAAANTYTDTHVGTEATARTTGDANTLASAHTYTDTAVGTEASARASAVNGAATTAQTYTDTQVTAEIARATTADTATYNSAIQRGNHTGSQAMSTISNAGNSATRNVGTTAGSVAAGDDARIVGALQKSNNLSDILDAAAARSNLGIVASGGDLVSTNNLSDIPNPALALAHLGGQPNLNWTPAAIKTSNTASQNDTAINAAITAVGAQGLILLPAGTYDISAHFIIPNNVDIRGEGGGSTSTTGSTQLRCQAAGAQIEFQGGGGLSGYFQIDGNSVATTPLKRGVGAGQARSFHNIIVHHNAPASGTNDLVQFYAAQNDYWVQCGFGYADRDVAVFDQGYGGALFERCEWTGTVGRYWHRFDNQVAGGPYPTPSNINFHHNILEGGGAGAVTHVKVNAGADNVYNKCWFFSTVALAGPSLDIGTGISRFILVNPSFQSSPNTRTAGTNAIKITGTSTLNIVGSAWYFNFDTVINIDTIQPVIFDTSKAEFFNCATQFVGTNSATSFQLMSWINGIRTTTGNNNVAQEISYNANRTGIFHERNIDGTLLYFPGTGFGSADVIWGRRQAGVVGVGNGSQQMLATGSGTSLQRPTAASTATGGLYYNTDSGLIEWCTGTAFGTTTPTTVPSYAPSGLKNRFDSKHNFYNNKGINTRKIHAGLGRASVGGNAVFMIFSDSAGAGCNQAISSPFTFDRRNAWPMSMAKEWARLGVPIAGTGLIRCVDGPAAADARWTSSGTVANSSAYVTLNANASSVTLTLAAGDFPSIATYTIAEVWYRDDGTGTWTASVNGAVSGTGFATITNANTGSWKKLVVPGVTITSGSTVVLTRTSSSTNLPFAGVNCYTPNAGVIVHNISQSGATASGTGFTAWADTSSTGLGGVYKDLAGHPRSVVDAAFTASSTTVTSATANFTQADVGSPLSRAASVVPFPDNTYIASVTNSTTAVMSNPATFTLSGQILIIGREPDGIFISLGGNDLPAASTATVSAAFTTIRGLFASSDAVYVGEHQKNDTLITAAQWEAWLAVLWTLADTADVPLFDWRSRVGNYTTALGNGLMGDNAAHMLVGAYVDWGRAVANGLLT